MYQEVEATCVIRHSTKGGCGWVCSLPALDLPLGLRRERKLLLLKPCYFGFFLFFVCIRKKIMLINTLDVQRAHNSEHPTGEYSSRRNSHRPTKRWCEKPHLVCGGKKQACRLSPAGSQAKNMVGGHHGVPRGMVDWKYSIPTSQCKWI